MLFASSLFFSNQANANSLNKNILLGAATTLALHEASHYLTARYYDFSVELDGLSLVYPDWQPTEQQQLRVASAGFQAQWLASEYAFRQLKEQNSDYYRGIVWGHIAISAAYTFLKNDDRSDIYSIADATGRSDDQILAAVLLTAGLDAARLLMDEPPAWLNYLSVGTKGIGITAAWSF